MAKTAKRALAAKSGDIDTIKTLLPLLSRKFDIEEFLKLSAEVISARLVAESCSFYIREPNAKSFRQYPLPPGRKKTARGVALKLGLAGWVMKNAETVVLTNPARDKRYSERVDAPIRVKGSSLICAPITVDGSTVGCAEAVAKKIGADNIRFVELMISLIAIAVMKTDSLARIEELTVTDDLTGLYNARYLNRMVDMEIRRAQRYGEKFSVVFIDLDRFKQVNDAYGHLVGSRILKETAKLIMDGLRMDVDAAFRYGGDEFVLALPRTDHDGAMVVAKRIQNVIRNRLFVGDKGERFHLTASFGIAAFPRDGTNRGEVIRLADDAMYVAKRKGRDGIEFSR